MWKYLLLMPVLASVCLCHSDLVSLIEFDDSPGVGRHFDGIGGLSGGGATSKLLVNYPQAQRDQILDYLFKPNFGASLQILKVEIGGDAQSTDGTEASHMHYPWEENYQRGYEWWLMKEAKKRNPNIRLYALPWGFPGWIGEGLDKPYANNTLTADYIVRWINGAKIVHDLHIDYVGIWNERVWNAQYVKILRSTLDARGFHYTRIIVGDGDWQPADYLEQDADFAKAVYALGCHYPGTHSDPQAKMCGKPLWSSEDYSTKNDEIGAGCWARILNQNYVHGQMTSTISWNLIASYYPNLPFFRCGLMTAVEPWSGNYTVSPPIWISAHTTQFTEIGWYYLQHGYGVGELPKGGSYVSLVSPDSNDKFTIVFETMSHDHSGCVRPGTPKYTVQPQTVTLQLSGSFAAITEMNVWKSKLGYDGAPDSMFIKQDNIKFNNGKAQLDLGVDEVVTLTTLDTGVKGQYSSNLPSKSFPLPYKDNFEGYDFNEEPKNLAQQMGSFEIQAVSANKFARQMMLEPPVKWCNADYVNKSLNVIGPGNWTDIFVEVDINLSPVNGSTGAYVAARVDRGGCHADQAEGIFFFALPDKYILSNNINRTKVITQGDLSFQPGDWHKLSLLVQNGSAQGAFDGKVIFNISVPSSPGSGFAALGTDSYGLTDFDNLTLDTKWNGQKIFANYYSTALRN